MLFPVSNDKFYIDKFRMQDFYKKNVQAEIFLEKTESIMTGMLEVDYVHLQTSNIPLD